MSLDYATLDLLRQSHPAWRLLRSDHAPLVASFLQRVFIAPNVRVSCMRSPCNRAYSGSRTRKRMRTGLSRNPYRCANWGAQDAGREARFPAAGWPDFNDAQHDGFLTFNTGLAAAVSINTP